MADHARCAPADVLTCRNAGAGAPDAQAAFPDNQAMALTQHGVSVTQDPDGILRVTVPAGMPFPAMLRGIDLLRDQTRSLSRARMVLDLRAIDPPPGLVEQAIVGEHIAREMQHAERLASIVAPGTRTGTSERVARTFNLDLRVFESEADALGWLRS